MPSYRVKPGMSFGPAGIHKAGEVMWLTEAEASLAVRIGKLELIEEGQAASSAPVPALKNELNVKIPDELKMMPEESEAFKINEDEPIKPQPKTLRKPRKANE